VGSGYKSVSPFSNRALVRVPADAISILPYEATAAPRLTRSLRFLQIPAPHMSSVWETHLEPAGKPAISPGPVNTHDVKDNVRLGGFSSHFAAPIMPRTSRIRLPTRFLVLCSPLRLTAMAFFAQSPTPFVVRCRRRGADCISYHSGLVRRCIAIANWPLCAHLENLASILFSYRALS
jgi:hypothetical protein